MHASFSFCDLRILNESGRLSKISLFLRLREDATRLPKPEGPPCGTVWPRVMAFNGRFGNTCDKYSDTMAFALRTLLWNEWLMLHFIYLVRYPLMFDMGVEEEVAESKRFSFFLQIGELKSKQKKNHIAWLIY